MRAPRECADERHELRGRRERELADIIAAARHAAGATVDGEKIATLRHAPGLALTTLGLRVPEPGEAARPKPPAGGSGESATREGSR